VTRPVTVLISSAGRRVELLRGFRRALDSLGLDGAAWTTPSAYTGDPAPMVAAAAEAGVTELVAKRLDAPYDPTLDPPPWRLFAPPDPA